MRKAMRNILLSAHTPEAAHEVGLADKTDVDAFFAVLFAHVRDDFGIDEICGEFADFAMSVVGREHFSYGSHNSRLWSRVPETAIGCYALLIHGP
jgi:hypothetical protein